MYARGSIIGEAVIRLAIRIPRTQSGMITALNSSCTEIPLDLASPARTRNVSSFTVAMNFAIGEPSPAGILVQSIPLCDEN